ncbi:hypothetical protein LBMAG18_11060 [Alphaproteobacteria bacterium]|nr:hypothetical protein LBMAG18_11060 [Alphaproteobacteria bacterium]
MNKFFKNINLKILYISFTLTFVISCSANSEKYGKITLHTTGNRDTFIFTVSEEFLENNSSSLKNEVKNLGIKISVVEYNLLKKLLKDKKFCYNQKNNQDFTIVSRQEKIYDMTFSHLIATSYKARPLTARSYFGECKSSKN